MNTGTTTVEAVTETAAVEEGHYLDAAAPIENPGGVVEAGMVLSTIGNPALPKTIGGFTRQAQPMLVGGLVGAGGFFGANLFREQVSLRVINGVWKTATPRAAMVVDTILQLLFAMAVAGMGKGRLSKAFAAGIVLNQVLAVAKALAPPTTGKPSRLDVLVFTPPAGGAQQPQLPDNGAPNGAPNGADAQNSSGIMPAPRGAGMIMPARRP